MLNTLEHRYAHGHAPVAGKRGQQERLWGKTPLLLGVTCLAGLALAACPQSRTMRWIEVAPQHDHFVYAGSQDRFTLWGFNYDHDENGRLIEEYWDKEWRKVEEDFHEMKVLGANVVRVHLQLRRIMKNETTADERSLEKVRALTKLAEQLGLYLDITGLACYDKENVPAWYDALDESARWEVQARFWESIARVCAKSPAVFCYDLMNEPVVPPEPVANKDWLPGEGLAGKFFVQHITLDPGQRPTYVVAQQWISRLRKAIRQHDHRHLITVGLVDWSLDRPGLRSGFVPEKVAPELDFISTHIYPERGTVDQSIETLRGFAVGKPVVIEEMFPLKCGMDELKDFIHKSTNTACGWIGFYWGKTPAEMRPPKTNADALTLGWLEFFSQEAGAQPL